MTKDLLFNIISEIHNTGFEVIALVSDMGPTNIGLWKNLDITPSTSWFINPVKKKRSCIRRRPLFIEIDEK